MKTKRNIIGFLAQRIALAALLGATAVVASGCDLETGTDGDKGRVTFSFEGSSCFLGCDLTTPVMAGGREPVRVFATTLPEGLTVASEEPAILLVGPVEREAQCCRGQNCTKLEPGQRCDGRISGSLYFTAQGIGAGTTHLALRTPSGLLFDRVKMRVAVAHRLALNVHAEDDFRGIASINLAVEGRTVLRAAAFDDKNRQLRASEGLVIRVPDSNIAVLGGRPPAVELRGRAAGQTRVVVEGGGVSAEIPVTVNP